MAFDPDTYLAKKPSVSFDPDAYLAQRPAPEAAPATPSEIPGPRGEIPAWAIRNPRAYGVMGAMRETAGPLIEAGGAILGGLAGAGGGVFGGGPVGAAVGGVLGTGLGYGIAKQTLAPWDIALGNRPAPVSLPAETRQAAANVEEGVRNELLGRAIVGPAINALAPAVVRGAAKVGGAIADITEIFRQRAARIAREAVGENLPAARQALQAAFGEDVSAAQALATVGADGRPALNLPTVQALLQRASARDPEFFTNLLGQQEAARLQTLTQIAGGANQTAAREAQQELKRLLNKRLVPVLEQELGAANIAGQLKPRFDEQARLLGEIASQKVEDVRRFTAAGERATAAGRRQMIERGAPVGAARYTYMGELADRAEQVATQAAEGSLVFGEAGRFAKAASDSLAAHGLKPLETKSVIAAIDKQLADPAIGPNRDVQRVLTRLKDDLLEWTNAGGVIDAWALDTIRKASVNQAARDVAGPSASGKAVKQLASQVLQSVRPIITSAVEDAGGAGYGAYLKAYEQGMQAIGQTKLGAEAMRAYLSNPAEFVKLVEGNSPKVVEKIFGPGSYNIFKELSNNTQQRLGKIAGEVKRAEAVSEQAGAGQDRLVELFKENLPTFRLPNIFSIVATTTNKVLDTLEGKIGKATMTELTNAAKSARSFDELLAVLPATERSKVLKVMSDPETWAAETVARRAGLPGEQLRAIVKKQREKLPISGKILNNLTPQDQQNQNELAR